MAEPVAVSSAGSPPGPHLHPQPTACPTCAGELHVHALQCASCGTQVSGQFRRCEFCALDDEQRRLLRVFLAARGNAKELERHLGVSYPTARARLDALLAALGITTGEPDPALERRQLLAAVAAGEIEVEEALSRLGGRAG